MVVVVSLQGRKQSVWGAVTCTTYISSLVARPSVARERGVFIEPTTYIVSLRVSLHHHQLFDAVESVFEILHRSVGGAVQTCSTLF